MRVLQFSLVCICFLGNINFAFSQWDKYPTYAAYEDYMCSLPSDYPELCRIVEFGTSDSGRKMLAAVISDNVTVREKESQFFYIAAINTIMGLNLVNMLHLIDYLLSNYESDSLVTKLVNNVEIWITPLANPDAVYSGITNINATEQVKNLLMAVFEQENFVMSAELKGGVEAALFPWWFKLERTADNEWWQYIAHQYADTVHENCNNNGYFTSCGGDGVGHGCSELFEAHDVFMDQVLLLHLCRGLTLSLSVKKTVPESELLTLWNWHYKSFLNYIEQVLYGIQGTVTDSTTGEPLNAKVFIENHDKDSSHVYSHLPHGDYYRPIFEGTYTVTFSADDYIPKTISDVEVENNKATVLDVQLTNQTGTTVPVGKSINDISICVRKGRLKITYHNNCNSNMRIALFDLSGRLIKTMNTETGNGIHTIVWNGFDNSDKKVSNGCYIIYLEYGGNAITKHFIFSK